MLVRRSHLIPSKPTLTEENLPDQHGKVRIPTFVGLWFLSTWC
jgi:hypothetical protein